ncbi:MAG: sulfur carrier protein ThiS [Pseudomonadota bacterium]|nr:sulfur carrier protein ThiS [Pseudomonadota bacterium]
MRIVVNGEVTQTAAATLAELCTALGFSEARIATAVNGDFVPEAARGQRMIAQGDRIEIVAPRQGG